MSNLRTILLLSIFLSIFSTPHTPEQNALVEQCHRKIVETWLALLTTASFHCRTRLMHFELLAISLMTFLPQLAPPKLLSKFYSIPLLITISYVFLEVSVIPSYAPTMMINYVLALSPMFFLVIVIPQRLQVPSLTH